MARNPQADIEQFEDGTAAFASAREVAWHKLGTVTEGAMTAEQALELAYLNTEVCVTEEPVSAPVLTANGVSNITLDEKFLTYRIHPKTGLPEALGVVGNRYVPIQNADAFEFLNYIADESGAVFETAGALNHGRRVFVSMKFPQHMELAGGQDVVDYYVVATNSHDGTSSFKVVVTPVRPVCTNTVALALSKAVSSISLKHTVGAKGKVAQARDTLGMVFKYQEAFEAEVQALVAQEFTVREFNAYVDSLLPLAGDASQRQETKNDNARNAIKALWNAPTQKNVEGTKWAAWNAVVEYADWFAPTRGKGRDAAEVRAERVMLGSRDVFKQKAFALLTK